MIAQLAAIVVLLASAPAEAVAAPDETPTLQVATVDSVPGTDARIGVVLFLPDNGPPPRAIEARVCFAETLVRLRVVEEGPATRSAAARMEQETDRQPEKTCVDLQFGLERPVESGTLAELVFEVPADATLGSVVELKGEVSLTGPEGTIPAAVRDGSITIVERLSIFACYFYMH